MDLSRQTLAQVRVPCETLYFALGVGWLGVERWQESIGRLIKYVYSDRPARREEDGSCTTAGVEQG
jgi:hypothetical protein